MINQNLCYNEQMKCQNPGKQALLDCWSGVIITHAYLLRSSVCFHFVSPALKLFIAHGSSLICYNGLLKIFGCIVVSGLGAHVDIDDIRNFAKYQYFIPKTWLRLDCRWIYWQARLWWTSKSTLKWFLEHISGLHWLSHFVDLNMWSELKNKSKYSWNVLHGWVDQDSSSLLETH